MKKIILGVLVVSFYCFPFVFNSMKNDFDHRSMSGYLLMVLVTTLLAFLGKYFCNSIPIIVGNIVSMLVSFYFKSTMDGGWDEGYFKPLSATQLIVLVSILNLIPQYIAISIANGLKRTRK
jgi:hypothetical protein